MAIALATLGLAALLALTACSGPTSPTPTTITVAGRLIDPYNPVANASVLIQGNVTTSAADGTFSVAGVTAPYDVVVSTATSTSVWIYQGLTRTDPTLQIVANPTVTHKATISGTIGTAAYQANEVGAVFPGASELGFGAASVPSGSSTFGPGTVSWGRNGDLPTTLYALRATVDGNGNPTAYTAYGTLSMTLHDGDQLTNVSIPVQSVTSAALSGSLSAPSGYSLSDGRVLVRFGSSSAGGLISLPLTNVTGSVSYSNTMVPVASGISYGVAAGAGDGLGDYTYAWDAVTAPNAAADINLSAASLPTAPAAGAANVGLGSPFAWTPLAGSVYMVDVYPTNASQPDFHLVTSSTSTTLPDLSAINRALPSGASYNIDVLAVGPFASVDAATGPVGLFSEIADFDIIFGSGPASVTGADQPGWLTTSAISSFTTAP